MSDLKLVSFGDIIDPQLRNGLNALASQLKNWGYPVVSGLGARLNSWLVGDDRGQFVLDNYNTYGFYYLTIKHKQVEGGRVDYNGHEGYEWMTYYFTLKNLFTDEIVLDSWTTFHNGIATTGNVHDAGFQLFQVPDTWPQIQGLANVDPRYVGLNDFKTIFTKSAIQFNEVISPGQGGGGAVQTGGGTTSNLPQSNTTNTTGLNKVSDVTQGLEQTLQDNPALMWLILGGIVLYFVMKK